MDGINWDWVGDDEVGNRVFQATKDRNTVITNKLTTPIKCIAFRIYPVGRDSPAIRSELNVVQ